MPFMTLLVLYMQERIKQWLIAQGVPVVVAAAIAAAIVAALVAAGLTGCAVVGDHTEVVLRPAEVELRSSVSSSNNPAVSERSPAAPPP